jgi:hypothetical protein
MYKTVSWGRSCGMSHHLDTPLARQNGQHYMALSRPYPRVSAAGGSRTSCRRDQVFRDRGNRRRRGLAAVLDLAEGDVPVDPHLAGQP